MDRFYPNSLVNTVNINTVDTKKIFYLPVVSTIPPGTLLHIKDICGNAAVSSIILSTTSYFDTIDGKVNYNSTITNLYSPSYAILSTNGASLLLMPDGKTNWIVLQNNLSNPIYGRLGFSSGLYTYFYNLILAGSTTPANYGTGSFTSPLGPGNNGWFYPYSQTNVTRFDYTNYGVSNDGPFVPGNALSTNWGIGAKGYIYSASNTTITFQTLYNCGMVLYYNNSSVMSNWGTFNTDSTITTILPVNAGYNPIKLVYFASTSINRVLLSWSMPSGTQYISDGTGVMYYNESSKYWS